jgi:hypothetical protein
VPSPILCVTERDRLWAVIILIRLVLLFAISLLGVFGQEGWIPLFDGKTLNGWQVKAKPADRDQGFWKVRDGAIACDSIGRKKHDYVWLVNDREFGDFELTLQVRGYRDSPGNTGVQVRSRFDEAAEWMNGPQVDIHPPTPWRTGLIYDETWEARRWIFPSLKNWDIDVSQAPKQWKWKYADEGDGWNTLRIVCQGTRIRTEVNGIGIADFDGSGVLDDEAHRRRGVGLTGRIALQLHSNDELRAEFRAIQVRPLR